MTAALPSAARNLLRAEKRALTHLRTAARAAIADAPTTHAGIAATKSVLRHGAAEAIRAVHAAARDAADDEIDAHLTRLAKAAPASKRDEEVAAAALLMLGRRRAAAPATAAASHRRQREDLIADVVADSLAASWAAGALMTRGENVRARISDGRLRRIAATETARAFGTGLRNGAHQLALDFEARGFSSVIGEQWDSVLDDRTCMECQDMNGEIVLPGESFPSGLVPGSVHPWCRCVVRLVRIDERTGRVTRRTR